MSLARRLALVAVPALALLGWPLAGQAHASGSRTPTTTCLTITIYWNPPTEVRICL